MELVERAREREAGRGKENFLKKKKRYGHLVRYTISEK